MGLYTNLVELLNTTLLELCDYNGDKTVIISKIEFTPYDIIVTFSNSLVTANHYTRHIPYSELKEIRVEWL